MGKVNDLWQDKYDKIGDDYLAGKITRQRTVHLLGCVGMRLADARDHVQELGYQEKRPS